MDKTLNLGVRAHDVGLENLPEFFTAQAIEILAGRVLSHNFRAVQYTMSDAFRQVNPEQLNQGMAYQLRRAFESRNIQIAVLSCYINPVHPDLQIRKKQLSGFRQYLEFCRDLGCSYVATETGSKNINGTFNPENTSQQTMDELLESLGQMTAWARDFGVSVAIEGVSRFVARSPETIRKILDTIDSINLRVLLDPVNLLDPAAGNDLRQQYTGIVERSFELYGDKIIAVHLKDFKEADGQLVKVPIGTGQSPFGSLIKTVLDKKPGLPIILEEQKSATMDSSIEFLTNLVCKL